MKTSFEFTDPGELEATMTITMKVKDWRQLRATLIGGLAPSHSLLSAIDAVMDEAHQSCSFMELRET